MCCVFRTMLGATKNERRPANEEAKRFMIETERRRQKRALKKQEKSSGKLSTPLELLIISLVNTAEFSYTFETVLDLTLYQFHASLRQIGNKIRFDNLMIGCYAGTVKTDDLSHEELSWLAV